MPLGNLYQTSCFTLLKILLIKHFNSLIFFLVCYNYFYYSLFIKYYISGSKTPKECESGKYTNASRQEVCQLCPMGYYCTPLNRSVDNPYSGYKPCPRGYFCPTQTGLDWKSCPRGTFSNNTGLYNESQCADCPAGKYCGEENITTFTGDCHGGYYCTNGVDRPNPVDSQICTLGNCSKLGKHTGMIHNFICIHPIPFPMFSLQLYPIKCASKQEKTCWFMGNMIIFYFCLTVLSEIIVPIQAKQILLNFFIERQLYTQIFLHVL